MNISAASRALSHRLASTATVGALLVILVGPVSVARTTVDRSLEVRPTISVTLGKTLSVSAPGVRAGWVNLKVTDGGYAVVARFARDYDIETFSADYETFQGNSGRKGESAFERILEGTRFLGGVVSGSGSIKLPRPGRYTVMALDTVSGIKSATFRAGHSSQATEDRPPIDGTVQALDGQPWRGPATLPHEGRLLLTNQSVKSLHALVLQHVKEGTTAAEYESWLYSNESVPNFNLDGGLETKMLSPRRRMTVDYRLPPGQYAVMCFETDPRSRMSHVFQGEVRMTHLN